jgi:hypothetical protein
MVGTTERPGRPRKCCQLNYASTDENVDLRILREYLPIVAGVTVIIVADALGPFILHQTTIRHSQLLAKGSILVRHA